MPDADRDQSHANLSLVGSIFVVTSGLILIGALISYATGEEVSRGRTHTDAALVLLFLGVALTAAAVIVFAELKARRTVPSPPRSDWE